MLAIGARVRVTSACDIDVIVGRTAVVIGHHIDRVAVAIAMEDTGTRFVLEPEQLEPVERDGGRGHVLGRGLPPYVSSGDAQPARTGVRP